MEALACVDYGIIGEGEKTIVELADYLDGKRELADVKGIIYKIKNGRGQRHAPQKYFQFL